MSNKSEATWHPNSGPELPHADLIARRKIEKLYDAHNHSTDDFVNALMAFLPLHDAEVKAQALDEAADEWGSDPDSWGDNERDYQNELRDRAAAFREEAK